MTTIHRAAATPIPHGRQPVAPGDCHGASCTLYLEVFSRVRGGAASGIEPPDLLITMRPYHAFYGVYQRQQSQFSHLWVQ